MRGGVCLNTIVTSKEAILKVSRELIQEQGWAAMNIRTLAKECHISVGSIYNYFGSKSDLIVAIVESVWCDIFHFSDQQMFECFDDCVEWAFERMRWGDEKYPGFFTLHSMSFIGESKTGGQQRMAQSWQHIQDGFYMVLMKDKKVLPNVFDETFTQRKFVEIIFSLMISALLQHKYDCDGILGMIRRVLYGS